MTRPDPAPDAAAPEPDGAEPDGAARPDDVEVAALTAELEHELEAAAQQPAKPRRWWTLPLRLLISAAMLWFLVKKIADVSFADLLPEWTAATFAWMGVALALTLLGIVISAGRWLQVLDGMDVPASFRRLLSHNFAGQFVSNVLPTTIGGDVLRVSRLAADTGDVADSFASVVIERLTGWLVLPLLTFTGLALNASLLRDDQTTGSSGLGAAHLAALIAAGTVVALLGLLFIADHPRLGGRFARRDGWRRSIGAVHLGVAKLRHRPLATVRVVGVGLAYQFVIVLSAWAAAAALGIAGTASFTVLLAYVPMVLVLQVLPIGISGLGVREGALVLFLSPLGVPKEAAVALGLLLFGLNLVASLAGAPAFLAGNRRREATAVPPPTSAPPASAG